MDRLGKDMAELMTSNQELEERARHAESEVKDLRRVKSDLENVSHDQRHQISKVRTPLQL